MRTQKKEVRFQAELRKAKQGGRTLSGYAASFSIKTAFHIRALLAPSLSNFTGLLQ